MAEAMLQLGKSGGFSALGCIVGVVIQAVAIDRRRRRVSIPNTRANRQLLAPDD